MIWKLIVELIICFIPNKDKRFRARLFLRGFWSWLRVKRKAKSVGEGFRAGKDVLINRQTVIKDHASLGDCKVMGNGAFIVGRYSHLGEQLLVMTDNHDYEAESIPFGRACTERPVIVGDFCWVGVRVTLLPGTEIGEGSIIQAGAVVHGKIPPYSIAGGNPAKVFKTRDAEHFNKLKAEGKFY